MYECAICQSINHAARLHCSTCGTIPAQYSLLRVPARLVDNADLYASWTNGFIQVIPAIGCVRAAQHHRAPRIPQAVSVDYFATE